MPQAAGAPQQPPLAPAAGPAPTTPQPVPPSPQPREQPSPHAARLEAALQRIEELENKIAQAVAKPKRIIRDPKTNAIVGVE